MKKIFLSSVCVLCCLLSGCTQKIEVNNIISQENEAPSSVPCTPNLAYETTAQTTQSTVVTENKVNLLPSMSKEERKTLHTFLSNFSETGLREFNINNYNISDVADFAISHAYVNDGLNKSSYLTTDKEYPNHSRISTSDVNKILQRYLGITISAHSQYKYKYDNAPQHSSRFYKNGYYYTPMADGEALSVSQATSMYDNKDGTYTVELDAYWSHSFNTNYYTDIEDWPHLSASDISRLRSRNNTADEEINYDYSATAIIKPYVYNGKDTYQLISIKKK